MSKFIVGDTVYLLPGAHGSEWTVGRTPENLLDYIDENGMTFTSAWTVYGEADSDGDVRLEQDDNVVYVQEEFLLKEKPVAKLGYSGVGEFVRDAVERAKVEFVRTTPKDISIEKLCEANEFLGHIEQDFLMEIITLAQRLK